MNKACITALLTLVCLSGVVMAQDVTYNYDRDVDFTKYHTYKWVPIKDGAAKDQLIDKQITDTFDRTLATKGLTKTDSDKADLYVAYQVGMDNEKQINAYNTGGAGWGYGARWGGGMTTATTSTIHIGQIVFDMYDPALKQMVWRGTGSKEIDPTAKPDKRQKNLDKGVAKLLKNYPPPVKK
jgi:hypothetical protein